MKMSDLTKILKPSKNCHFLDLCANFLREIKEAQAAGEAHYEVAGRYTRSGNPYVIHF